MADAIAVPVSTPADLLRAAERDPQTLALLGFLARYTGDTQKAYRQDLAAYDRFCHHAGIRMLEARRVHLELYLRTLQTEISDKTHRPLTQSTVARRFATVRLFLEYAEIDGLIDKNWARHVTRPTVDRARQYRTWLDLGDFYLLARTVRRHGSVQDTALLTLMCETAMRVGSICALDVTDVHVGRGRPYVQFVAKGNKLTQLDLPTGALLALQRLIDIRPETGPLFCVSTGHRMTREGVARVINRFLRLAGITRPLTPHGLRRSFITVGRQLRIDWAELQGAAGHADPQTTRIYDLSTNPGSLARHAISNLLAS